MATMVPSEMPSSEKSSVMSTLTLPMPMMMPAAIGHEVDRVAEVDPVLLPDLRAEQADHAVEHDGDAAEHATGDRGHQGAELGREAEEDRDGRGHVVGGRGVDPGGRHDADVLGVGRGGGAADRGGEHGAEAVGGDRAGP